MTEIDDRSDGSNYLLALVETFKGSIEALAASSRRNARS